MERGQSGNPAADLCRNVTVKARSCTRSSRSLVRFRMYRPVRIATEPEKIIKDKCPDCYGTGYVAKRKKIKVTIPAGIDNGQMLRDRGNGEPGTNGGPRGRSAGRSSGIPAPGLQASGYNNLLNRADLLRESSTRWSDPHQDGGRRVEYEVKPGTQTDTRVRLKGKGVPSLRNRNVRGDHFVTLVVQVPERMTEAQKEALRKFDDAMNGIVPEGEKHKKKGLFGKLEK